MTVLYAYYGQSCTSSIDLEVQRRSTDWAKGLCDGKNECSGLVHYSALTDPYVGCTKDFLVVARCPNGDTIANLVPKEARGKTFHLKCSNDKGEIIHIILLY